MQIDISDLLITAVLHLVAIITSGILVGYLAIILPVTFSAWFLEIVDRRKIGALLASSIFVLAELGLLLVFLSGQIKLS